MATLDESAALHTGHQNRVTARSGKRYLSCERFFRFGEDSEITDDQGRPVLPILERAVRLMSKAVSRWAHDSATINAPQTARAALADAVGQLRADP